MKSLGHLFDQTRRGFDYSSFWLHFWFVCSCCGSGCFCSCCFCLCVFIIIIVIIIFFRFLLIIFLLFRFFIIYSILKPSNFGIKIWLIDISTIFNIWLTCMYMYWIIMSTRDVQKLLRHSPKLLYYRMTMKIGYELFPHDNRVRHIILQSSIHCLIIKNRWKMYCFFFVQHYLIYSKILHNFQFFFYKSIYDSFVAEWSTLHSPLKWQVNMATFTILLY